MVTTSGAVVFLGVVFTCTAYTSAFFLNWGSPEPVQKQHLQPVQQPQWPVTAYYQQRVLQSPQYTVSGENGAQMPMQIPAIPIQVPLQAQLSPAASIQNVQLVPCLCPVAQDYEYDKVQDNPSSVFVTQIKPQSQQQQPQR